MEFDRLRAFTSTEIVYRRELRPVITTGAEIMDQLFREARSPSRRSGSRFVPRPGRLVCTGFAVLGYGTGVEGSAAGMAAAGVHGFPVVLTSFVGRAGEVCEVAGLLEEYRLVTVAGPGGVGKTRLAAIVAGPVAARFADGVWLAELAPVRDPARVAPAAAATLGIREQAGMPAADALMRVLGRRQLLLVLDNCEHVIPRATGRIAGARLRRITAALAAVVGGVLAWAAVPAASAAIIPVPGPDAAYRPAPAAPGGAVRVITVGGMPG